MVGCLSIFTAPVKADINDDLLLAACTNDDGTTCSSLDDECKGTDGTSHKGDKCNKSNTACGCDTTTQGCRCSK
jgi:hypothetical protein